MRSNTLVLLLVAVVLGFTVTGCLEIAGPGGIGGSEGAIQNCSDYTGQLIIERVVPNGGLGYPSQYTYTLSPGEYTSLTLDEGKYRLKLWAPTRSEWVSSDRYLYVPARGAERNVELETTRGMDPVDYVWAIVIESDERQRMWARVIY